MIILNLSSIKLTSKHSCKWNSTKCNNRYVIKVVFGNHLKCYWSIGKSNWSLMDEALCFSYSPAKMCWSSRHVLKTSSKCLQRNNFSSLRRFGRQKIVTLKISSKHVLNTCLENVLESKKKKHVYWGSLYLTMLNLYLINLYLTNLRSIQNALIRTQ